MLSLTNTGLIAGPIDNQINRPDPVAGRIFPALIILIVFGCLLFSSSVWSQQSDQQTQIKTGRAKAQGCTRCHGRNGIQALAENNGWTDPVGQFVTLRLTELREGVTYHPVMTDIAVPLTDEDISDISAWIQSLADKSK